MNYKLISESFWTDSKVDDEFTPEDKYFYLYLITNPHTSLCGCYEISVKQMERETGYNKDTVMRLIDRMENHHDVIRYDAITKEILLLNWSKYNWTKSDKVHKALEKIVPHIKSQAFRSHVKTLIRNRYIETENDTENDTETETENDTETETENDTDTDVSIEYEYPMDRVSKKKRFVKPSLEEVKDYIFEKNYSVNPDTFWNFYESNGWKVGKNPMKNWKAAVSQWESKNRDRKPEKKNDIEGWFNS